MPHVVTRQNFGKMVRWTLLTLVIFGMLIYGEVRLLQSLNTTEHPIVMSSITILWTVFYYVAAIQWVKFLRRRLHRRPVRERYGVPTP